MNSRFLLFIAYALILTTIIQYFFLSKPTEDITKNTDILLSIDKDSIVIPNIPKITVINNLTGSILIQPCQDISISIDSKPLSFSGIEKEAPAFCNSIDIVSGSKSLLPFEDLAKVFANMSGKYIVTLKTSLGDRVVTFSSSVPGTFRIFLTDVVYRPIYNTFVGLIMYLPGHSLGWAIIIITLIIRLILLVPQHQMLSSQKKLQILQPKIKEIQKKYKDDQAKLGAEMLSLYKQEGVNPMGSCLPLLIQMPILIGLYWVISGISDISNVYHLYSFFENFDIRNINSHFYGLDLKHVGGIVGGIFALILGVLQYIQAKLSFSYNKAPKKTESIEKANSEALASEFSVDPEMMQKMMIYTLPVMIMISSFFFPLGIGLYWFIGTIFVIVQQWYVNKIGKNKKNES